MSATLQDALRMVRAAEANNNVSLVVNCHQRGAPARGS